MILFRTGENIYCYSQTAGIDIFLLNMATLKILLFLTFLEIAIIGSLGENSTASNVEVGDQQNESELTKLLDLLQPKVSKYPNVPTSEYPNIPISQS